MSNSGPAPGMQPPPAALGASAAGKLDLHRDIALEIGQQVESMILDAKHKSETKVGKEIQKIKIKMGSMSEKIKAITERVNRLEPGAGGGLLRADLVKSMGKLEEVWEGEVGNLKHELWQTIQAHNHNADLLKHHKDAIDQVQGRMTESANPELEQVHAQLMQVDKIMQKELAKDNQMESLMQRIAVLQQSLQSSVGQWPGGGMPPPVSMPQANAAAAAAQAGKKAQRKVTKATKATKSSSALSQAAAASLRAEAPEFVPTTSGWSDS